MNDSTPSTPVNVYVRACRGIFWLEVDGAAVGSVLTLGAFAKALVRRNLQLPKSTPVFFLAR